MFSGRLVSWCRLVADSAVVILAFLPFLLDDSLVLGQAEIFHLAVFSLSGGLADAETEKVTEDGLGREDGELVVKSPVVAADEHLENRWVM